MSRIVNVSSGKFRIHDLRKLQHKNRRELTIIGNLKSGRHSSSGRHDTGIDHRVDTIMVSTKLRPRLTDTQKPDTETDTIILSRDRYGETSIFLVHLQFCRYSS